MARANVTGALVGVGGLALVGVGWWARRDVARALAQERIVGPGGKLVTGAAGARSLAEAIRESTLESTGGRTYSETESYLAGDGSATSDAGAALEDERTGKPVANPEATLWLQATTLQTALMQAYLAFRLAELTAGLGAALAVVGTGLARR